MALIQFKYPKHWKLRSHPSINHLRLQKVDNYLFKIGHASILLYDTSSAYVTLPSTQCRPSHRNTNPTSRWLALPATTMAAKASTAVGSTTWIASEKENVLQLLNQEKEEIIYPAQHEIEWLNEHMAEIFSCNQL